MAAPNIVNVATIIAKTYGNVLTTSNVIHLANPASSGNVIKVNNIVISNVDGSSAAEVTLELNSAAAGTGTATRLVSTVSVPADASLIVTDKSTSFYMEENTSLKGFSGTNGDLEMVVSYEVIT
jgi:hypothetical protein